MDSGADVAVFIKDREDYKLPFVTETSHIVHLLLYSEHITGRGTGCIQMID